MMRIRITPVLRYVKRRLQYTSLQNFSHSTRYPLPQGSLSYLSVPGSQPLVSHTVGDLVDLAAFSHGDKEAVVVCAPKEIRKTFQELKQDVDKVAAGLLALGFKKGDRLGIWGPNSYEWYLTHKGGMKAGLIIVNINPAYQSQEIAYCLGKVGVKGLLIAEQFKTSNYYEMMTQVVPEVSSSEPCKIKNATLPHFTTLISMGDDSQRGTLSFPELLKKGNDPGAQNDLKKAHALVQFDDVCNIQFTSGTTGLPKGVMLSHHNLINNAISVARRFEFEPKDKLCIPVPLFHCFGGVIGALCALSCGATAVFPSPGFSPLDIVKSIEKEKCSVVYGTPTMHIDVLNHSAFREFDMSSLRMAATGGSICPEELIRQMKSDYTVEQVTSLYGMTETSPVNHQNLLEDDDKLRAETVGYPGEHTEAKIVDKEGRIVPIGTDGELWVRGYMNMLGYWDDEDKTNETIDRARWLKSGDLAVMLPSGHCRIVGRLKDQIIRGGENIYPRELEDFFHTHPQIVEAQIFGVPDLRMVEEVAAWIRVKDGQSLTEGDLRQFCKGKIAHYKIPRYIIFTNEFPKTTSGKVQKYKMREETIRLCNIQDKAQLKYNVDE